MSALHVMLIEKIRKLFLRFRRDESGESTFVTQAVMIALIVVLGLAILQRFFGGLGQVFDNVIEIILGIFE